MSRNTIFDTDGLDITIFPSLTFFVNTFIWAWSKNNSKLRVLVFVTYITLMLIKHHYIMKEPTVFASTQILPEEMSVKLLVYINRETVVTCLRLIYMIVVVNNL